MLEVDVRFPEIEFKLKKWSASWKKLGVLVES